MTLKEWCFLHRLDAQFLYDELISINDVKYLLIQEKNGKIVDKEGLIILSLEERQFLFEENVKNIVFDFGGEYYYIKIADIEERPKLTAAIDFKYIGQIASSPLNDIDFSHLGVHSDYELLNGSGSASEWCKKAKFLKIKTLGICDKNTLAGTLPFQLACQKHNIKSIIGMTCVVLLNNGYTSEVKLFCKSEKGWRNLLKISKNISVDNDEKHVNEDTLFEHSEGLILVFEQSFLFGYLETVELLNEIKKFTDVFDCYYQICSTEYDSDSIDKKMLQSLKFFCEYVNVKPVLLNDSYYLDESHKKTKKALNSIDKIVQPDGDFHFKTLEESYEKLNKIFSDESYFLDLFLLAIENTTLLTDKCNFTIDVGNSKLPRFEMVTMSECDNDEQTFEILKQCFCEEYGVEFGDNKTLFLNLIEAGFRNKTAEMSHADIQKYRKRIDIEVELILKADLFDYFLILWDVVYWCKNISDIKVGTGRGSVGGSLMAYLLDITTIDPIQFDLMFERFLNETRALPEEKVKVTKNNGTFEIVSKQQYETIPSDDIVKSEYIYVKRPDQNPDIDVDFEADRREDVKNYMRKKYGYNSVCNVGAYDRLKGKSAIKDLGRLKGLDFNYINAVTKGIDNQITWDWVDIFKYAVSDSRVYKFIQHYPDIVNMSKYITNQPSTGTVHASAMLITPKFNELTGEPMEIWDWLPVKKMVSPSGESILVSQWEGKYTDVAGFLKEDILGLNQLDKFKYIQNLINKNENTQIVLEEIELDDEDVFKFFSAGFVEDVFQFGSDGLRSYCKYTRPNNIDHIIAMNALYRPGPMKMNAHKDFADIKNGTKKAKFDFGLKSVTEHTAGLYVYQEQIMKAVVVLGGFTLVESDNVRTIMKKFDKVKMKTFEEKFITNAIQKGCPEEEAKLIWDKLNAFSAYGFNLSHSAAYGLMSYWSMWFKVKYPIHFWSASLQFSKDDHIPYRLFEMSKINKDIKITNPDVNSSTKEFTPDVKSNTIFWSLIKIKGLGDSLIDKLLLERSKGEFKSVDDFSKRMQKTGFGKNKTEALILSGAFDIVHNIKNIKQRKQIYEQFLGYTNTECQFTEDEMNSSTFWLLKQKELTGFGDINFISLIQTKDTSLSKFFITAEEVQQRQRKNKTAVVAGIIDFIREKSSKKGKFGSIRIRSNNGYVDCTMWSDFWSENKENIEHSFNSKKIIAFKGIVNFDEYNNQNAVYSERGSKILMF